MTLRARTDSVEATRALGGALANLVRAGDVVLLSGDLGAGKTALTQGLGRALGIDEPITSPTFTLARSYEGRITLHHLDVYRMERLSEVFDVGLPEILDGEGVVVIEWGDVVSPVLPAEYLEIRLAFGPDPAAEPDVRELELRCVGNRWGARNRSLQVAIADWMVR